jgi:hypothetical protein
MDDIYETTDIASDRIADRHRVVYRFRVRRDEDDYVCEQTAYFDEVDGKIVTLRILCSGFLPLLTAVDESSTRRGIPGRRECETKTRPHDGISSDQAVDSTSIVLRPRRTEAR